MPSLRQLEQRFLHLERVERNFRDKFLEKQKRKKGIGAGESPKHVTAEGAESEDKAFDFQFEHEDTQPANTKQPPLSAGETSQDPVRRVPSGPTLSSAVDVGTGPTRQMVRTTLSSCGETLQQKVTDNMQSGVSQLRHGIHRTLREIAEHRAQNNSTPEGSEVPALGKLFTDMFPNAGVMKADGRFAALFQGSEPVEQVDTGEEEREHSVLSYTVSEGNFNASTHYTKDQSFDLNQSSMAFMSATHSLDRRRGSKGVKETVGTSEHEFSPFVNPAPISRRIGGTSSGGPTRPTSAMPPMKGSNTGQQTNANKPPARPGSAGLWSSAAAKDRPATAPNSRLARPLSGSSVDRAGRTKVPLPSVPRRMEQPAIHEKQYYFLHIQVHHGKSYLKDWLFDVLVTDVTDKSNLLQHKFTNLRLNEKMSVVFHPPGNVIMSPVDDIPWVRCPQNLFGHTLHVQVMATYPKRTAVVETFVKYGEPSNDVELAKRALKAIT
eukprot:PhF_6_TR28102/c0_g1_i1/m.41546